MPEWLSPEWAGEVGSLYGLLPAAGDAEGSVTLSFVVAPRREVAIHWTYEGGKATSGGTGAAPGARLALSLAPADAADVLAGRVEPSVAFMRGRLKASGDGSLLLAFLESTAGGDLAAWLEGVEAAAPVPS